MHSAKRSVAHRAGIGLHSHDSTDACIGSDSARARHHRQSRIRTIRMSNRSDALRIDTRNQIVGKPGDVIGARKH